MPEIGSLFVRLGMDTAQFDRAVAELPRKAEAAGQRASRGMAQGAQGFDILTRSARQTQFAVTNLGFQLNDIFTGLASGQRPMQIFAQQSGQIVQLFTQGGGIRNVLGGFVTTLRSMVTPLTVSLAGVTALAVGFGVLVHRANQSTQAIREFGVMLKGLSLESVTTAENMEATAKQLRDVGLSASEARDALSKVTRAGINPALAGNVVRIGQNLIPTLGEGALERFIDIIKGGVDPLGRLGQQLGVVTAAEIAMAREAEKNGQQFKNLDDWIRRIGNHVEGDFRRSLSDTRQRTLDLGIAWNRFLDSLSNTGPVTGFIKLMGDLASGLEWTAKNFQMLTVSANGWRAVLLGISAGAGAGLFAGGPAGAVLGAGLGGLGGLIYGLVTGNKAPGAAPATPGATTTTPGPVDMDKLVAAIIRWESNGNPRAVSPAGAKGLMQLMPGTARDMGVTDVFDPAQNVAGGTKYLKQLLAKYNGNVELALMAYNWGPGKLDAAIAAGQKPPAGVSAYAAKVMGTAGIAAGTVAGPSAYFTAGGGAGGETPADIAAKRAVELANTLQRTRDEIASERTVGEAYRTTGRRGGLRAEANVRAAAEADALYGYGLKSPEQLADRNAGYQLRRAQFIDEMAAKQERAFDEQTAHDQETRKQLELQISLFGQSSSEIDNQIDLLKIRQQAEAANLDITNDAVQARIKETNQMAETNRLIEQQRVLMNNIKEFGAVLESTLSSTLDSLADGTFKLRKAIGDLLLDLGKLVASQGFRALLYGETSGGVGGGLVGMIGKGIFGAAFSSLGKGGTGTVTIPGGIGGGIATNATGGSWRVGGAGAIDSQLVAMRASPGELIDVSNDNGIRNGGGEVIRLELNPNHGWIADVADRQIRTRSGTIVQVAVAQSQKVTKRNFNAMAVESTARQG